VQQNRGAEHKLGRSPHQEQDQEREAAGTAFAGSYLLPLCLCSTIFCLPRDRPRFFAAHAATDQTVDGMARAETVVLSKLVLPSIILCHHKH